MIKTDLNLLGAKDACALLNISRSRLSALIKNYNIPHYITSSGKIFRKEDLEAFQASRAEKMKFSRKK